MSNYKLFVFEGKKTEPQIFDSLKAHFFSHGSNSMIHAIYGTNIYSLYHKLSSDSFLDSFKIMQESCSGLPSNLSKEEVSEIYLFFDYDAHDPTYTDDKLREMLRFFNNETEQGKLYISYPMVESLKHIKLDQSIPFESLVYPICMGKVYKKFVHVNSDSHLKCLKLLSFQDWKDVSINHCCKLNYIKSSLFEWPSNLVEQAEVFELQIEKYVRPSSNVSVISGFPIFLLDYFGLENFKKIIEA